MKTITWLSILAISVFFVACDGATGSSDTGGSDIGTVDPGPAGLPDEEPPTLVQAMLSPTVANGSTVVTLGLFFDEPLEAPPVVEVVGGPADFFELADQSGSFFSFGAALPASDLGADGAWPITVSATDVAGNRAVDLPAGEIVLDTVAPSISGLAVTTPTTEGYVNLADRDNGSAVVVALTLDEPAAAGYPDVAIGPYAAPCEASELSYTCSLALTGDESDGIMPVSVRVADPAGNLVEDHSLSVVFDFTPPAPSFSTILPEVVMPGDSVGVFVVFPEPLAAAPLMGTTPDLDLGTPSESGDGTVWTWMAVPTAPSGVYQLTLDATDLAGNAAEGLPLGSVVLSDDSDSVSDVQVTTPSVPGYVNETDRAGGATVTISFDSSGAETPSVSLGDHAAECTQETAPSWTCTYTMVGDEDEGEQLVTIQVGSSVAAFETVTFDFTGPARLHQSVSPMLLGPGAVLEGAIVFSEPTQLSIQQSPGLPGPGELVTDQGDTFAVLWTFSYTAPDSGVDSTHEIGGTATDQAGNEVYEIIAEVVVDMNAPLVSNVTLTPEFVADGETVTLTFDVSETLDADPIVRLGAADMSCALAESTYTCTHLADAASDAEGPAAAVIFITDPVGAQLAVTVGIVSLDFTPPQLVAASVAPPLAGQSSVVSISLTFDEPLLASPVIASTPDLPGGLPAFSQAHTTWTGTWDASQASAAGSFDLTAEATDLAGNVASLGVGTITVDPDPTLLSDLVITPDSDVVAMGELIEVSFTTSEELLGPPEVTIGSYTASCVAGAGLAWTCSYTTTGFETQTSQQIQIVVMDTAGNIATETPKSYVFDFTPPQLKYSAIAPELARPGDVVTITVGWDGPLAAPPQLSGSPALPGAAPTIVDSAGIAATWEWTVPAFGTNAVHELQVQWTDVAGNTAAGVPVGTVELDFKPPQISNVQVTTPSVPGYVNIADRAGNGVIDVTFSVDEPPAAGYPKVIIGNYAAICGGTYPNYACAYELQGFEINGDMPVTVTTSDEAGNVWQLTTQTVGFDFTMPAVLASFVAPASVDNLGGHPIQIVVAFTEELFLTPTFSANPSPPGWNTMVEVPAGNDQVFSWAFFTATGGSGSYSFLVDAMDRAGNIALDISAGTLQIL